MSEPSIFSSRLKQTALKMRGGFLFFSYLPALICIFFGGHNISENTVLRTHGVATQGQIILIEDRMRLRSRGPKYKISYVFKQNDNAQVFEFIQTPLSEYEYFGEQSVSLKVGRKFQKDQIIQVKYVPLNKFSSRIEPISRVSKGAPTFVYVFLVLFGSLMGIFNTILLVYKIKHN